MKKSIIVGLALLFLGAALPQPVGAISASGMTLENGGAGPAFDAILYRGKHFDYAPTQTISQVCVYAQVGGTSATVALKAKPDGSAPLHSVFIPILVGMAWNCASTSIAWQSHSLFVYKTSGNAAIGYDDTQGHDSRYSENSGASWNADGWRRGYKIVFAAPGTVLQNGGAHPEYDHNTYRGKLFTDAREGIVTKVCAFADAAGSTLTVGLKTSATSSQRIAEITIPVTTSGDWNCASASLAWSASSIFVYKASGTAGVGTDQGLPGDSWWGLGDGSSWFQDSGRRGFAIEIT